MPEPDSLDALGDLFKFAAPAEETVPTPNTAGRWFISVVNPAAALTRLPTLKLKPGIRFVCYLNRIQDGGVGAIYAVPEEMSTTAQLETALFQSGDRQHPPQPQGSFMDFMDALDGDFSPASFMIASILRRELQEMGSLGDQRNWSHHHLVDTIPPQVQWKWRTEPPQDLAPKVLLLPDGRAAVEFFTCRVAAPVAIYRYVDQYPARSYTARCGGQAIGTP
ncbi:hypothetical protein [Leptolyngbya sp. 'hensonii']|uniref:hypothetical protein n=1 Tax=Leptolyngbya sp. 'hensonii' TaxID=1922337 RepID=UPI00209A6EDF|nr:hypothetical protein [Leptolyngbya sp. 'hensonii']